MPITREIKTVVFLGSAKNVSAPWGGPVRLGSRVLQWVVQHLKERTASYGDELITHSVTVFDPLEVFGPDGALGESGAEMKAPHFFLSPDKISPKLAAMHASIKSADCYLVVSPEYNHSIPPALSSMMGHFGGSNYAYKPCGTITYSPGPWVISTINARAEDINIKLNF